jgi:anti-sigma B factor antagonist
MPSLTDFGLLEEPVDEHTHVIAPRGEIDALTAPQLGRCLLGLAEQGKTDVVVDLTRVTFMDSTGIGVILNALRRLTSRDGHLVLVCPSERVTRPFEIAGLLSQLRIFPTREAALGGLTAA